MSNAAFAHQQLWVTDTRFYLLCVQTNLFGGWELLKAWGGRGNRRGGHMAVPIPSHETKQPCIHDHRARCSCEPCRRPRLAR